MDEIERQWEELPIAELHQLDSICDRFEYALAQDPDTRIESFIVDLSQSQQRLIVRELVPLEIEQRLAAGASPTPDEFASRFPQWEEELRSLATQCFEDLEQARLLDSETDDGKTSFDNTAADSYVQRRSERQRSNDVGHGSELSADGMLGQYRLQSEIGRGGMGQVWHAHDTKLSRDVAIKVLLRTNSHDENTHERFLREARAIAAIRHNHVVTIYAVEEFNKIPFLVMELVEGTTLQEYLRERGKLEVNEITSLACQIAEGLAAAHKQGVIHRDVKPANILLEVDPRDADGLRSLTPWNVKITDFGLARISSESQLTNSGIVTGTPQYMSPEQANGQEIDARSDLFSLGSLMYAMCAGRAAFHAESALGVLRQVADKPAPSLLDFSRDTPDWLIEIIEKLMAKSPDARFQSAGELEKLLDQHLHDVHTSSSGAVAKMMAKAPAQPYQAPVDVAPVLRPFTQAKLAQPPITALRLIRQRPFATGLCTLLMIALVGFWIAQIVFRVEIPHGTLIVKSDDPDVQISVKSGGTEVALFFPRQKKEILLKVGEYTIELVKGKNGLKLSTNKFEIQSGQEQRTVTVEFEPAVVADKDPPMVEEQAKARDVKKPFAWPAEALWHGRVAAPDLSQAKELYRDDFASLETTWPIAKSAGSELGREQGTYFISAAPELVRGVWANDKTYANFACQVVGRVKSGGTQWYLNYTSATSQVDVRFHLNGTQALAVSILNDGPPRNTKLIRHTALNKGDEFNKLLVVAVGNRFEIYANDVAICDPIVLDKITPPGRFALGAVANQTPVRAEFKSFTVWSAEGLPTPEERLAAGPPYNLSPVLANPNQIDTSIPHDKPLGAGSVPESSYKWPTDTPRPAIVPFTRAEAESHQAAWAQHLGLSVGFENSVGMKFRIIPPGQIFTGSSRQEVDAEAKLGTDRNLPIWYFNFLQYEAPQHQVTLTKPFGIGVYEVTRGQFRQFVDDTGYKTDAERNGTGGEGFRNGQIVKGPEFVWNSDLGFNPPESDDSPVVNITCNDGTEFCKWLTKKEGVTYRLPTEAEWAFACRSGNPGRYCFGDDDAMLKHYAWVLDGDRSGASEVGCKLANAFGLFDMHGNVWEWCQDWHGTYPSQPLIDPTGPESGEFRVGRGGAWGGANEFCRTAFRSWGINGAYSTGFRVVRTFSAPDADTQAGERNE